MGGDRVLIGVAWGVARGHVKGPMTFWIMRDEGSSYSLLFYLMSSTWTLLLTYTRFICQEEREGRATTLSYATLHLRKLNSFLFLSLPPPPCSLH